ncbi:sulfatase-like hydrolase/transferase [Tenacibaculum jejuense]|uniref:Sulfatase, family S1-29 n=1 Tax=Tenacibaculum jejuense TaxID=584609 RepID=A0A238UAS7_9FLAO|nr:sulfatase-like hydrolase/transferase [Tenacibaculum jejuense]SNR16303.1 sulfatase, family S1-29 precursor [Tenacibaculum jejuense]
MRLILSPILLVLLVLLVLITSCSKDNVDTESPIDSNPVTTKPNILLIIADDMGLDATPGYSVGSIKPNMPNLQSMINNGVRFENLWSYPTCTPTRSSILTGKYGFRTRVMQVDDELSNSETSIQKYLKDNGAGYQNAVIGKWHLSRDANHPNELGVDYYAGLLNGAVTSYWNWTFTENGVQSNSTEYTTTKFTDLAIDWVKDQDNPWFLWLAYNAPHTPFHLPPTELHSQGNLPTDEASIDANPQPYYMAMIEAMDSEIGRLLNSMSEEERNNTVVIFIGDNGTPNQVAQEYRSRRVKGTVYQGGVNVPMIVYGKDVNRFNETEPALVNTTDLFATIANIAGVNVSTINDSRSFWDIVSNNSDTKVRDYGYTEIGRDSGSEDITVRNDNYKYILFSDGTEAFYNVSSDFFETNNLLNNSSLSTTEQAVLIELKNAINNIKN